MRRSSTTWPAPGSAPLPAAIPEAAAGGGGARRRRRPAWRSRRSRRPTTWPHPDRGAPGGRTRRLRRRSRRRRAHGQPRSSRSAPAAAIPTTSGASIPTTTSERPGQEMLAEFRAVVPIAERHGVLIGRRAGAGERREHARPRAAAARRSFRAARSASCSTRPTSSSARSRPRRGAIVAAAVECSARISRWRTPRTGTPTGGFATAGQGVVDWPRYLAALRGAGLRRCARHARARRRGGAGGRARSPGARRECSSGRDLHPRRARCSRSRRCGAGRPMVFQHGLGGDAAQAAEVFPTTERLAAHHGRMPRSRPLERWAAGASRSRLSPTTCWR